jgi:hypothetical protein
MAREPDLFEVYRWLLLIVGTVYTIVCLGQVLWRWLDYFGQSRPKRVLGHYAVVLLLRTRLRRFAWDLCQVGALLAVLLYIIYLHRGLAHSA